MRFVSESKNSDQTDIRIAEEVVKIHERIGNPFVATGEWKWINKYQKKNYLSALNRKDVPMLAEIFSNMFHEDASYALVTGSSQAIKTRKNQDKLKKQIFHDINVWCEFLDQNYRDLSILDMPRVGNPYGVLVGKTLISVDTPRHDYFAYKLSNLAREHSSNNRPHILEIGGGYGGLIVQLCRRLKSLTVIDCDLPESLYLAYYFLRKSTDKKIVWALDKKITDDEWNADIILLPCQNMSAINGRIDIMFNCNSLSEIAKNTVNHYMALLHRLRPRYFFHQNSNVLLFPNSPRHIEILASQFPINKKMYKEIYRALSPWEAGSGRYREFLYQLI